MESNLNQFQSIRDGIQLKIITGKYHRFQYSTLPPPSLLPPSSPPHKTVKSDKSNAILFVFINRLGKISRDCCRNGSNILRLLPIKKNRRRDSVAVIALNHPHQYTNCLRVCVCVSVCDDLIGGFNVSGEGSDDVTGWQGSANRPIRLQNAIEGP